jgi:hypothetical protein
VGLKFRARQTSPGDVQRALDSLYDVLNPLGAKDALDEKLAEYVFFPLSQVFNETKSLPQRCLEVAVKSVQVLVEKGWRHHLSPQMGKQLLILLTIIAGGAPDQSKGGNALSSQPEELCIAVFNCMTALFRMIEGPVAEQTIFNEIGTATIVDQTVYLLLERITDGNSDGVQRSAMAALRALFTRITDRVTLASIMPRAVSALTKILKPSTRSRRSFRLLQASLQLLTDILRTVLNDTVTFADPPEPGRSASEERIVLDESWLKATASQIKISLASVVQIRRHERREVQKTLLDLCLMVIEQCSRSLKDVLVLMVETVVVLSELDENNTPNDAYSALQHLATVHSQVVDILKDLLHSWTMSFQRTMQGNDEVIKQRAIKQMSTTFQVLSQVQGSSDILENNMALGLCDSVSGVVQSSKSVPQQLDSTISSKLELAVSNKQSSLQLFSPVILEHRSQQRTLIDLRSMIIRLNRTDSADAITRSIMNRVHQASGDSLIAPFWLSLEFLRSETAVRIDDFLSFDSSASLSSRATMIEELYSVALPILNEPPTAEPRDWRLLALALEAVALQAQQLGVAFQPELIDALYPVLQFLASNNPNLQNHAMVSLNMLTKFCEFPDTKTMLIENVDYLVNSVALKLNTFDVSPYPPQVLLMMVKLSGAGLIPYLDDLVDSIFGIIDMYHGYPKLVELLFSTLAAIVEEGVKEPSLLAITESGRDTVKHRKHEYQLTAVSKLVEDIARRRAKRARMESSDPEKDGERKSHPERPWTRDLDRLPQPKEEGSQLPGNLDPEDESDEALPPPKEPEDGEKPLSKPHTLLLHIVKSTPPHLSSPSPFLRRSLLNLLTQALPVLAKNENSFLPLINDIWPSVSARIAFPPSLSAGLTTRTSSSTEIIRLTDTRVTDDGDIKEETFVTSAACTAVSTMCEHAGDFMASRVEADYPRWRHLYLQVWQKVRADAEKNLERRRVQHQKRLLSGGAEVSPTASSAALVDMSLSLSSSSSTSTRLFTPHHTLWRSLLSLFISILVHVRLPLAVGDEICEFLVSWIAAFAGPRCYYDDKSDSSETTLPAGERELVGNAIRAMEAWNRDLTWFLFQRELVRSTGTTGSRLHKTLEQFNGRTGRSSIKFAAVVF